MSRLVRAFLAALAFVAGGHAYGQSLSGQIDEEAVLRNVRRIITTASDQERADLMVEFVHDVRAQGSAVIKRPAVVEAISKLLDDATQAVIVQAAYLLGDIGPAASSALPKLKAMLKTETPQISDLGFEFNRDKKPQGALEYAIAKIEASAQ